jgi:hypothetical protein
MAKGFSEWRGAYFRLGTRQGLPALVLDENAPKVSGLVFSTDKLAEHWQMLMSLKVFNISELR